MSGTRGHHQRLGFFLCDAVPGLCSSRQFFVCLWVFRPLVLSSLSECIFNRVEIRRLAWPLPNNPLFYLQKPPGLLLLFVLGQCPLVL